MSSILEANDLTLGDLLPHRPPMVLIDDVLEVDSNGAVTRSVVKPEWPLAGDDAVDALIMIEVAAQAAGVCNGWDRIVTQGPGSDKMGYLVGIKRALFHVDCLTFDRAVFARVQNTYCFESLREVACTVDDGHRLLAEITLQLFQV